MYTAEMKITPLIAALFVLSGCTGEPPEVADNGPQTEEQPALKTGIWRAVANREGAEIPFSIEITPAGDSYAVTYLNGPERMAVEEVLFDAESGRLELNFPSYTAGCVKSYSATVISTSQRPPKSA